MENVYKGAPVHLHSGDIPSNCTTTTLGSGGTFTGEWTITDGFSSIVVSCRTDQDGTLYLEQSYDALMVDSTLTANVAASVKETQKIVPSMRYYRTRYVNGSVAQSLMRLETRFGNEGVLSSLLSSNVQADAPAIITRPVESALSIAEGKFSGISIINKFGANSDVDTGSVPEDIWEGGGLYTGFPDSTLETISVSSTSVADAAAGTGARTIRVMGLDANYEVQVETITLNGTTPVASVNTFRRVHTAAVQSAGSGGVNAGVITCTHTTTTGNVFFAMQIGRNQTNVSAYTVPAGFTAYMRRMTVAIAQGTTAASAEGSIWTRAFGMVYRSRRPFLVSNTSRLDDDIFGGLVFTEKSDIILRITGVSNSNTSVTGGYDLILVEND